MKELFPRMTIGRTLEEPIAIHALPRVEAMTRLDSILKRLGLSPDVLEKFPHQISGGQARRVGVARALLMRPEIIVADEPTAGLDVSVQGDLLNLLLDLQREFGLTYLLVSHNLNVIIVERPSHGRRLVKGVFDTDVRTTREQQLHNLNVAPLGSLKESGSSIAKLRIDVSSLIKQSRD